MNTVRTSKLLIGLTIVFVGLMLALGHYAPNSLIMGFAGTSAVYTGIRIAVLVLLVALLVTNPPRSRLFRAMLGTWAIALTVLATQLLLSYQLFLLDAVVFIELAVIFAIEALEAKPQAVTKKIPVKKIPARQRIQVMTASS